MSDLDYIRKIRKQREEEEKKKKSTTKSSSSDSDLNYIRQQRESLSTTGNLDLNYSPSPIKTTSSSNSNKSEISPVKSFSISANEDYKASEETEKAYKYKDFRTVKDYNDEMLRITDLIGKEKERIDKELAKKGDYYWWNTNESVGKNILGLFTGDPNERYKSDTLTQLQNELKEVGKAKEDFEYKEYSKDMSTADKYGWTISGNLDTARRGIEATISKILGQEYNEGPTVEERLSTKASSEAKGLEKVGLDVTGSISRMLPNIVLGGGVGAASGSAKIGEFVSRAAGFANFGGGAYNQAKEEGYSEEKATLYGATIGAMETALTWAMGSLSGVYGKSAVGEATQSVINNVMSKVVNNTFVRQSLTSFVSEGSEEFLQEYIDNIARDTILDEKGFLKSTWENITDTQVLEDALYSALVGGITGITMDGAQNVEAVVQEKQVIKKVEEEVGRKLTNDEKNTIKKELETLREKQQATENDIPTQEQVDEKTITNENLTIEEIDNQIATLESQLNENLSDSQYEEITTQIRSLEEQAEQIENETNQISPTVTQQTETNSLVDASSNTLENGNSQNINPIANEQVVDNQEVNNNEQNKRLVEKTFSEQVDEVIEGKYPKRDMMVVSENTPKVLQEIGLNDLPITMTQKHLYTITNKDGKYKDVNYHDIDPEVIKQIPEALERPLNVLKSDTKEDSIVVVTELADKNGDIIVASIKIDGKGQINDIQIDSNVMTSAYGKSGNYDYFMKDNIKKGNLLYDIDEGVIKSIKKETDTTDRLQLSMRGSSSNATSDIPKNISPISKDNIAQNEKNVNLSNESEVISSVKEQLTPLKQATKELKQVQKEVKAQVKELKEQISEFKALTKEQYQEYDKMYQESLEQLKEMKAPVRNNLTEEESERADNLEVMEKAFGLDTQEIEEYNELQDIERGMNYDAVDNQYYEDYYEEQFFEDGVETPNVFSKSETIYDIKTKLDVNTTEAKAIYDKIANDPEFTLEDTRNLVEEKIDKANTYQYENEEVKEIRKYIRSTKLDVSYLKQQFPSSKDYNAFRKANFGKVKLANSGTGIDVFYQELLGDYEGYFDSSLTNEMDQLQEIIHFMDNNPIYETMKGETIPDEYIDSVANDVYNSVLDSEAARQLDEDFNSYVKEIETEIKEGVQPKLSPVENEIKEIPKDPTKESSYEDDTPKSRKQLQRRLDTVNKQIERMSNLEDQMKEKLQKYEDRIEKVKAQIEEDIIKNGPLSPFDKHINDNVIQGIYDSSTKYVEKYDKYHNKLQELTNERNQLEEQIENTLEKKTRKDIQRELVEKTGIVEIGLDNANRMSKFMLNNTDPIRVQEMIFGQELGNKINDEFFQKVKNNTSDKTRWLNKQRNDIKDLGIKARSKESAAVQKYGEKQWINEKGEKLAYGDNELAREFPNVETQRRIKRAAQEIRGLYDSYLETVNPILSEMGYNPIPKRADYFRHFQELNDKFSQFGIPLNLNDMKANDLPTDINGITADFNPGKNFFASTLERMGEKTTYDAITGIDGYLEGVANLIYHTEDVQRLRGFEQYIRETYGQQHGYEGLENLQPLQRAKRMKAIQDNRLSNYASWLHEYTNQLAGKKAMVDRSFEDLFGRKMYSILDTANRQVGANMIGFNISSAGTNLIGGINALAKTDKVASVKGLYDTVINIFHNDGFVEKNGFLTSRFGSERLSKTPWQKMQDAGFIFMSGVDNFTSNFVVRSKFNELKAKGYTDTEAHIEAGKFASKILADRSQGAQPTLYNSKVLGLLTKFQYEVNNQVYSTFYDTLQESKAKSNNNAVKTSASMLFTLGQLAVFTHMFGSAFESLAGYNPTFDILEIISKAFGFDDDEDSEDTVADNLGQAFSELLKDMPYISTFLDGGRIPVSEAFKGPIDVLKAATGGKDEYGQEVTWEDAGKSVLGTIPYWFLPTGYGQAKKTTGGLEMFDSDLPVPGSYTDSGNLRFDIEPTRKNIIKSAIFGKWANEEAQKYIDSGFKTINKSKIDEFKAMGMKSSEYKKLKAEIAAAGKTNQEKVDYITSLEELNDEQKNLLINNILDRDYDVDVSDYDSFSSYEEFDYSYRYPEKYNWLKSNNISYKEYTSSDEAKEIYNYAYNNPEKYSLGMAATNDFKQYYKYKEHINELYADKNSEGKSISGSRKNKVINYVNSLPLDIPQKAMIIRSEYSSFDEYNNDIVSYVDSLSIPYENKVTILKELDMTVYEDGTVRWD